MGANNILPAVHAAPSEQAVRRELRALVSADGLRISERNRRFLSYVVSEALCGRGDRIKAYSIGVDVFGRTENFDPTIDPIVRVEAARLRSALCAYYRLAGADHQIRILSRDRALAPS
jgi:hypothetical protein